MRAKTVVEPEPRVDNVMVETVVELEPTINEIMVKTAVEPEPTIGEETVVMATMPELLEDVVETAVKVSMPEPDRKRKGSLSRW